MLRRQLIPDSAGPDASAAFLGPIPGLGLRGGACMAAAGEAKPGWETMQRGSLSACKDAPGQAGSPCVPCGVCRRSGPPGGGEGMSDGRGAVERSVLTIESCVSSLGDVGRC